jgi:hypothetical protein
MATWNRNVDDDGDDLVVTNTAQNPNPPPAPGHGPRTDTADDITTFGPDRAGGGARIIYHAGRNVSLTGISMKDGTPVPPELDPQGSGNLLTLVDTGAADTDYSYNVEGEVDGTPKTADPMIRNQA